MNITYQSFVFLFDSGRFPIHSQRVFPVDTGPVGHYVVHGDFLFVGRVLNVIQHAQEHLVQVGRYLVVFMIFTHVIVVENTV